MALTITPTRISVTGLSRPHRVDKSSTTATAPIAPANANACCPIAPITDAAPMAANGNRHTYAHSIAPLLTPKSDGSANGLRKTA